MIKTIINLRKRRFFGKRELIVMAMAVVLTTIGIKAADNLSGPEITVETTVENGQCPPGMAYVSDAEDGFCIDEFEASPGSGCPQKNPANQGESRANLDYSECRPESKAGSLPWRFISQNQASIACAKAGKRLPTNKEWLAAALGTPDIGQGWTRADCNVAGNWGSDPGAGGSGANCKSANGAYDMIGNVWEWVDGTVHDGAFEDELLPASGYVEGVDSRALPSATNAETPDENYYKDYFWIKDKGVRGMARGGYWNNNADAGQYSLYVVSEPSFSGTGVGFRCVK